jgi:flagellar biosynthesis chaperone FliJ
MIDAKKPILVLKENKIRELKIFIDGLDAKKKAAENQLKLLIEKSNQEVETKKKELQKLEQEKAEVDKAIQQLSTDKTKLIQDIKKIEGTVARIK